MEYLAKKSFSFLQDCAFASIYSETYTNKWNILQKSPFLFCKILHSLVLIINHILIMEYLARKSFSFLQDCAFTSINSETYTNKWNILQKSRFPFCKILHLLVKAFLKIYITSFIFHWYTCLQKTRLLVLVKFFRNFVNM